MEANKSVVFENSGLPVIKLPLALTVSQQVKGKKISP